MRVSKSLPTPDANKFMTADQVIAWSSSEQRWFGVGDRVIFCDEWGYWRDDPRPMTITGKAGWLVRGVADDGTPMMSDGHTTRDVISAGGGVGD